MARRMWCVELSGGASRSGALEGSGGRAEYLRAIASASPLRPSTTCLQTWVVPSDDQSVGHMKSLGASSAEESQGDYGLSMTYRD